jgi:hypothetical protein
VHYLRSYLQLAPGETAAPIGDGEPSSDS